MIGCVQTKLLLVLCILTFMVGLSGPALAQQGPPGNDKIHAFPNRGKIGPCDVPPVWGKKFPGADRFVAVLDGAAYCDQETGLVWEGTPDTVLNWSEAIAHCADREVGGRKGWSLPMREQLASLVDTNSALCNGGGPCLPDGHPFQNVQSLFYWSATTFASDPTLAGAVNFLNGDVIGVLRIPEVGGHVWCARGGQVFDGNTHNTLH